MKKLNVELIDEKPKSKDKEKKVKPDGMIEMIKFVTEHGVGMDGKRISEEEATEMVKRLDIEDASTDLESYEVQCENCGAKNIRSRTYCWYCDADMTKQAKASKLDEAYEEDMALFKTYEADDKDEKLSQMAEDEKAWKEWLKRQRGEVVDESNTIEADEKWREYWQKRERIEAIVVDGKSLIGKEEGDDESVEWMHGVLDMDGKWKTWGELLDDNMGDIDERYVDDWYKDRILDTDGKWKTILQLKLDNR